MSIFSIFGYFDIDLHLLNILLACRLLLSSLVIKFASAVSIELPVIKFASAVSILAKYNNLFEVLFVINFYHVLIS